MTASQPSPLVNRFRCTFRTWRKERLHWMLWLKLEHQNYADPKFDPQRDTAVGMHDDAMRLDGANDGGWWFSQVLQYVKRANLLGLDTLAGRQQLVKGLAAYTGMVESKLDADLRRVLILALRQKQKGKYRTLQWFGDKAGIEECPHRRASELGQMGLMEVHPTRRGRTHANKPCKMVIMRDDAYERWKYLLDNED